MMSFFFEEYIEFTDNSRCFTISGEKHRSGQGREGICNMHKKAEICKKKSKLKKIELSTYPHSKHQKTWKKVDFEKVFHIFHTKRC